jgi:hypothetical protein
MAGGDHVAVDRQRADAAAAALEALRNALAEHVPAILTAINNMRGDGADLPAPASLLALQGRSAGDAAEMRAAARLATQMNNQLLAQQPPVIVTGKLDLATSWNAQALATAAAKADAQALLTATSSANTRTPAARAAITGVAADLTDHQGDTAYLTAFWSQNGIPAAATSLATTLNHQDGGLNALSPADQKVIETRNGTLSAQGQKFLDNGGGAQLLSAQDQQILTTFGNSLAAVSAGAGKPGGLDAQQSQQLTGAFARPADPWSAAMLVKYGPSGAAYGTTADGTGPKLLSGITEALLNAREHGGYTIPLQSRFASVDPANPSQTTSDPTHQLAQWGPLDPVMQRAAQNGTAATQVINGYNPVTGTTNQQQGVIWAHQLIDPPKITYNAPMGTGANMGSGTFTIRDLSAYPDGIPTPTGQWGYINIPSSTSGAFLYAATADHSSAAGAQAVLNIMQANAQIDPSKTTLDKPIREAFVKIADGRVSDFGMTSYDATANQPPGVQSINGVPYAISNQNELSTFLQQALHDPQDAGRYKGAVEAKMSAAVEMTMHTKAPWLKDVSSLVGMIDRATGINNFKGAEATAANKAKLQEFSSLLLAPVMLTPTRAPAAVADLADPVVLSPVLIKLGLLEGTTGVSDFAVKSGDPAQALFETDQAFVDDKTAAQVTVVQGMVNAGVLKPDPSWYKNGHVVANSGLTALFNQTGGQQYDGLTLDQWVQQARDGMQLQQ